MPVTQRAGERATGWVAWRLPLGNFMWRGSSTFPSNKCTLSRKELDTVVLMDAEKMTKFFVDRFLEERHFESDFFRYSQKLREGHSF